MTSNSNVNDCLDEIETTNTFNKNSNVNYETETNSIAEFSNKWKIQKDSDLVQLTKISGGTTFFGGTYIYMDSNGMVRIRGMINPTVTKSTAFHIFNIPEQFRPSSTLILPISVFSNWNSFPQPFDTNRFFITINTNGVVTINTNHMVSGFTSVDVTIRMDNFIQYNKNI